MSGSTSNVAEFPLSLSITHILLYAILQTIFGCFGSGWTKEICFYVFVNVFHLLPTHCVLVYSHAYCWDYKIGFVTYKLVEGHRNLLAFVQFHY